MVIAVDIRRPEKYRDFIFETFKLITAQHPSHSFIFIFNRYADPSFNFSKNITPLAVKPKKISLLNDLTISSLLKKYKAEVFVTAKSLSQTKTPQCVIAYDKVTARAINKAQEIITDSEFSKKDIMEKYKVGKNKIDVVYFGVDEIFQQITFEQKERIKEKYAGGNEFFLFAGEAPSPNNLLNLLKAFSAFKKRQKSNMHLLITTKDDLPKEFLAALRLFKFKSEVQILAVSENELAVITGAAYAFVYPVAQGYSYALQAMRTDVPVITSNADYMTEICGEAALYFDDNDHKNIADKMMLVYKDETLRQQLVEKGKDQIQKYSWDNSAAALWKCIEKACR